MQASSHWRTHKVTSSWITSIADSWRSFMTRSSCCRRESMFWSRWTTRWSAAAASSNLLDPRRFFLGVPAAGESLCSDRVERQGDHQQLRLQIFWILDGFFYPTVSFLPFYERQRQKEIERERERERERSRDLQIYRQVCQAASKIALASSSILMPREYGCSTQELRVQEWNTLRNLRVRTLPDFPLLATEFNKRTDWDSTWSQTAALMMRRGRIGLLQVLEITKKLQDRHKHQWRHDHPCSFSIWKHRSTDHGENTSARVSSGNLEVGSTEFSFSNNASPQITVCLLRLLLAALRCPARAALVVVHVTFLGIWKGGIP